MRWLVRIVALVLCLVEARASAQYVTAIGGEEAESAMTYLRAHLRYDLAVRSPEGALDAAAIRARARDEGWAEAYVVLFDLDRSRIGVLRLTDEEEAFRTVDAANVDAYGLALIAAELLDLVRGRPSSSTYDPVSPPEPSMRESESVPKTTRVIGRIEAGGAFLWVRGAQLWQPFFGAGVGLRSPRSIFAADVLLLGPTRDRQEAQGSTTIAYWRGDAELHLTAARRFGALTLGAGVVGGVGYRVVRLTLAGNRLGTTRGLAGFVGASTSVRVRIARGLGLTLRTEAALSPRFESFLVLGAPTLREGPLLVRSLLSLSWEPLF